MADGTLVSDDAAVRTILAALDSHTSFMGGIQQTIDAINNDIRSHYVADSSTTFQGKIQDWIAAYQGVQKAVDDLRTGLSDAHGVISRGVQEAADVSSGWTPSGDYYSALAPQ